MGEPEDKEKKITDILKKVVSTGVSAAFMTEDALKSVTKDLSVPKEILQGLVQNAKNTKDEFINTAKSEVSNYLKKIDLTKEVDRILKEYDIEVSAKLSFKKKDEK